MTADNFCFYLQNRLIQTCQTGGQLYNDTSPFSIPWLSCPVSVLIFVSSEASHLGGALPSSRNRELLLDRDLIRRQIWQLSTCQGPVLSILSIIINVCGSDKLERLCCVSTRNEESVALTKSLLFNDQEPREITSFIYNRTGKTIAGHKRKRGSMRTRERRERVRDSVWQRKSFGVSHKLDRRPSFSELRDR